jgi:hypothetical protein
MIAAARRQAGWKSLRSIPFLGAVRVAYLLAVQGRLDLSANDN